jgi:hypothetical protein
MTPVYVTRMVDRSKEVIQVLHLIVGLAAVGLVEALAARSGTRPTPARV